MASIFSSSLWKSSLDKLGLLQNKVAITKTLAIRLPIQKAFKFTCSESCPPWASSPSQLTSWWQYRCTVPGRHIPGRSRCTCRSSCWSCPGPLCPCSPGWGRPGRRWQCYCQPRQRTWWTPRCSHHSTSVRRYGHIQHFTYWQPKLQILSYVRQSRQPFHPFCYWQPDVMFYCPPWWRWHWGQPRTSWVLPGTWCLACRLHWWWESSFSSPGPCWTRTSLSWWMPGHHHWSSRWSTV